MLNICKLMAVGVAINCLEAVVAEEVAGGCKVAAAEEEPNFDARLGRHVLFIADAVIGDFAREEVDAVGVFGAHRAEHGLSGDKVDLDPSSFCWAAAAEEAASTAVANDLAEVLGQVAGRSGFGSYSASA